LQLHLAGPRATKIIQNIKQNIMMMRRVDIVLPFLFSATMASEALFSSTNPIFINRQRQFQEEVSQDMFCSWRYR
jgi:hypothetical protein